MFDLTLPARTPLPQPPFLPTTRAEMDAIGWDSLDILLVTGDAYVDHPSFGVPLLGRWLVGHGYRVGIVAQPRWKDEGQGIADLARMGRPRLFAGVSAGALDSMLAHYTAFRKKRHDDAYTPGGEAGSRPNRAVIVYAGLIRKAFPGLPLLAGGIEASLRRITHYDFWADSLRRSILFDARLDILSCGMGERALLDVARRLDAVAELVGDLSVLEPVDGELWPDLWAGIPGTARLVKTASIPSGAEELDGLELVRLPSHDEMLAVPRAYLDGTVRLERETHQSRRILAQPNGDRTVLLMPPAAPLTTEELDGLYAAVLAASASFLQGTDPGGGNDRHEHHHPSRLRGRMLVLLAGPPSGPPHRLPFRSVHPRRGKTHCRHAARRFHFRRGRPKREYVGRGLPSRSFQVPTRQLHVSIHLQRLFRGSARLHRSPPRRAGHARREACPGCQRRAL